MSPVTSLSSCQSVTLISCVRLTVSIISRRLVPPGFELPFIEVPAWYCQRLGGSSSVGAHLSW